MSYNSHLYEFEGFRAQFIPLPNRDRAVPTCVRREHLTVNKAFKAVIAGCATPQPGREDTWINKRIRDLYCGLHALGHAHSVEVWQHGDLVGGLYGVSLGRAFFGEVGPP